MKLKKLFAGILAVAMMATMAAPAFAATTNESTHVITATPGEAITIDKAYTQNNGHFDSDKVNFELVEFDDGLKVHVTGNRLLTNNNVQNLVPTFTAGNVSQSNDTLTNNKFTITLPNYEKVGIYTYQVQEVGDNTLGMTYDEKTYTLRVAVANQIDAENKTTDTKVCYVTLKDGETKLGSITNTYNAGNLSIAKKVDGNLGDRSSDNKFKFKVTFTVPADKTLRSTLTTSVDGKDVTWTDKVGTVQFELAHGEHFTIQNLPYGLEYNVEELDADGNALTTNKNGEYEVTYDQKAHGTMNAETLSTGSDGEIATGVETTITNTYGDTTIDTGVILDNAPYIALMMVVVAGAAVMIIKKRRHFED